MQVSDLRPSIAQGEWNEIETRASVQPALEGLLRRWTNLVVALPLEHGDSYNVGCHAAEHFPKSEILLFDTCHYQTRMHDFG
jgi:hypothetical protein